MASEFGRKFYDLLRIHYEQGTKVEYLDMNEEHKQYVRIIDDLFEHYRHNPAMNVLDFIRNKYDVLNYSKLYKLTRALNFVVSMASSGMRDMQRFKANYYADRMAKIGDATGDWKPMDKAVSHFIKINGLDQPDPAESLEDQIPKMGYLLSIDPRDAKPEAQVHTPAQIEAMFKRYGVERDAWQRELDARRSTADDYDVDGKLIRRGRPASSAARQAEDVEYEELEKEWERELEEE